MANPITRIILTAVDRTKAAVASAKNGLGSLGESVRSVGALFAGIGVGFSLLKLIGTVKSAADEMDAVGKSAQSAGTSVEKFSALSYVAGQSGVGVDVLRNGLVKLVGSLDDARTGTGKAAEAWQRLRLDPKQFSDPSDALIAIAERFKAMPDGINKTSLAIALFGEKLGPKLIPLLNQGRDGIAQLSDEARDLGKVFGTDASRAAERFNDNLDRMKATGEGLGVSLAVKLMPSLNQFLSAMDDVIRKGAAIDKIAFFGAGYISEETLNRISDAGERVQDYNAEIFKLQQQLLELQRVEVAGSPNIRLWEERIAALEKTRATLIEAAREADADRARDSDKTSDAIAEGYADEVKAFKKATDEKISDAQRLQTALQSSFSRALSDEADYMRQAKKLREQASRPAAGNQDQDALRGSATIAAMKLERLKASGSPEDIRDQAAAVKELAGNLADQEYATWLLQRATLAEADAADKSAAAAGDLAKGLAEQMAANEKRMAGYGKLVEEIDKPVSLDIVTTAQADEAIAKLQKARDLIEFINSTPVKIAAQSGGTSSIEWSLSKTALQYGRRN